jgi:FkbM family methyltransferase
MNRTLRKLKRELIAGLSKIHLKKVKSDYFGMSLTVPVVYGMKNGGYIVPAETWMGDCLRAFVTTKPGTVIDIGVNVGLYLVKLRLISNDIPYIGFEPNPSCQLYTQELIRLNNFQNAKVIPIALAEKDEITRFYASKIGDETGSLIAEHHQGKSMAYSFDVLVMKGDDLLKKFKINNISVIKIDVEEAEIYVMRGLVDTLKQYRPYVYSEILDVHNNADQIMRKNEMCDLFANLDYKILGIDKNSLALRVIENIDDVGVKYQQEYIFCPDENVDMFIDAVRQNTSNIKVN